MDKNNIKDAFLAIQSEICHALEQEDGKETFHKDLWDRPEGGGGLSRVLQEGGVIEKGGVNFSAVHGKLPNNILHALKVNDPNFFATGVSIVIHPHNPWVPIIHMNIRYFELSDGTYWFGGGIDLTPHYVNQEQATFFHTQLKNTCDAFQPEFYPKYKQWADDYFYIKHRQETRGIGGIFFDRLNENTSTLNKKQIFDFVCAVGRTFAPTYVRLMNLNKNKTFTPEHKQWQHLRRGRYVEFNLVYDKGTKFGLDTNGRIESILMSLPKTAQWFYDYKPEIHSEEQKTLDALKKGIDWI